MNLKKFLLKYADEVAGIANVIQAILPAIPIGREDRARVDAVIEQLETAAENVAKGAENAPTNIETKVTVRKSDVQHAVNEYLKAHPELIAKAVAAKAEEVGNGNAKN